MWFPSPDTIFLGNGLGDRAVILGIFKPVCLECQALPTLRFTSFSSLTLLSDGCSYGRVESDLLITRFAVDVSCYFHCPIAESDSIYTHTRLKALCPGLPGRAGTRKVKPIWILLKQETVSGSGISWAMQVCALLQTDNHASTPPLSVLQAGCPSCRPTNSVKALKTKRASVQSRERP